MTEWNKSVVIADSKSLTAGTPTGVDTSGLRAPTVIVKLENLEGSADDTLTIRYDGIAATYEADERTNSTVPTSYAVNIPQSPRAEVESSNGVTYSVEVRANPN